MNVTIESLKNFVDIKMPIEKLAKELTRVGLEIETVLKYQNEDVLKVDVSPNRYDCLSAIGIAREVAMLERSKIKIKKIDIVESDLNKNINVDIIDKEIVPKYYYYIIDDIKICPSPDWLKKELEAYGFRPLNNIIDITNYVMVLLGQPLHAFDYDKIVADNQEKKIIVRHGKKDENVITLDGQSREVDKNTIVISKPNGELIDLAGIMGGFKSEIDDKTKTIILQAALFDPKLIRATKKRLNHDTEAAYRYERGVDHSNVEYSLKYAAKMIFELAQGKIGKINKIDNVKYRPKTINTSSSQISDFIGHNFSADKISNLLSYLGFKTKISDKNLNITVPSWRELDINWWQDIAEEVIRVYDISKIKLVPIPRKSALALLNSKTFNRVNQRNSVADSLLRKSASFSVSRKSASLSNWERKEIIKDELFKLGLTEVYNYSFVGEDDLEKCKNAGYKFDVKNLIELKYPLSPELKYLRPNLTIGLLKSIVKNPQADKIEIFEIENVFDPLTRHPELISGSHEIPKPRKSSSGSLSEPLMKRGRQVRNDVSSQSESTRIGIACAGEKSKNAADYMKKLLKRFKINNLKVLRAYVIKPEILKLYKIRKSNVTVAEVDFKDFLKYADFNGKNLNWQTSSIQKYRDLSEFPTAERDLALVVDSDIENEKIKNTILNVSDQIISCELFDEFVSDKLGVNKKSVAFHISIQASNRTLTSSEAESIIKKILENIKKELNGELRK